MHEVLTRVLLFFCMLARFAAHSLHDIACVFFGLALSTGRTGMDTIAGGCAVSSTTREGDT